MIIGIPTEIKLNENRVALTPSGAAELVKHGHRVLIEAGAGVESGYEDREYEEAGAVLVNSADQVWSEADVVVKVKEPLTEEYRHFRKGLVLFAYLHLAAEPDLAKALMDAGVTAFAYETVKVQGTLPLLTPMSEVAGRLSTQIGARLLEKAAGGMGVLLSGVPGVSKGNVTVIGGGVVGTSAAKVAIGMGANVTILDNSIPRLRQLDDIFGSSIQTLASNKENLAKATRDADLLISSVLIPGDKAPKLVTEEMVKSMKKGAVIVDVAIDQGGSVETIDRTTSHDEPTYVKHGVVHYAVPNIPGAVPRTSTAALTNATLPYVVQLANQGAEEMIRLAGPMAEGLNVKDGAIVHEAVAHALNLVYEKK